MWGSCEDFSASSSPFTFCSLHDAKGCLLLSAFSPDDLPHPDNSREVGSRRNKKEGEEKISSSPCRRHGLQKELVMQDRSRREERRSCSIPRMMR